MTETPINFRVRVEPERVEKWKAAAERVAAPSLSAWVRDYLDLAATHEFDSTAIRRELVDIRIQLQKIGNNLNQLTRVANHTGQIRTGELEQLQKDIAAQVKSIRRQLR